MVVSDMVADRSLPKESITLEKWSGCIDGALPKEDYIDSIRKAGFQNVQVLNEQLYAQGEKVNGRKISSVVIKAVKD